MEENWENPGKNGVVGNYPLHSRSNVDVTPIPSNQDLQHLQSGNSCLRLQPVQLFASLTF